MKFPYLKTPRADLRKKWISRPIIPVTLFGPKGSINVDALIDSGADRRLFNAQIGREIGLEIEKGERETFSGIESGEIVAYLHKIKLQIIGIEKIVELEAGFTDAPGVFAILGEDGFFDAFKIKFEKDHDIIEITPVKNERKRIQKLLSARKISQENYQKIKNLFLPLETLFIFGTSASALKETINTFKEIKGEEISVGNYFEINKKAEILPLFVPVYKSAEHILAEEREITRYHLNEEDFNLTKNYYNYLADDRIVLMIYDTTPQVLEKIKESFVKESDYYKFEENLMAIDNPALILSKVINHFSLIPEKFDRFEKIEKGKFIVHFERIRFNPQKKNLEEFLRNIESVKNYELGKRKRKQLEIDFRNDKISQQEFDESIEKIIKKYKPEEQFNGIKIKYIPNHYYYPVVLSESKHKIDYLNHIITEESEVRFIKELDDYLAQEDNLFAKKFDWWLFSKLDETTDEVYIPWYNPKTEKIEHFKPDFIFWMKEKNKKNYYIVFIDPKGTEHTEAYRKIDGFRKIFENQEFKSFDFNIKVRLFCKPEDKTYAIENYKDYWLDDIHKILEKI